jgi:thioredoxin-like negative regulator of GroEL
MKPAVTQVTTLLELERLIHTVPGVVLSFGAPWCSPTVEFKPIYEKIARACQSEMMTFVSVNTDEATEIAKKYKVSSLPQFVFFYQRKEYNRV